MFLQRKGCSNYKMRKRLSLEVVCCVFQGKLFSKDISTKEAYEFLSYRSRILSEQQNYGNNCVCRVNNIVANAYRRKITLISTLYYLTLVITFAPSFILIRVYKVSNVSRHNARV